MESMSRIRVLLGDDHEPVLAELRVTLVQEFEIVAVVRNGPDIIAEVERLDPDVLATDISMPLIHRIKAVFRLRSTREPRLCSWPCTKIRISSTPLSQPALAPT